jgi:hypothetical protein
MRWLDGRMSTEVHLAHLPHLPIGEEAAAVIAELLSFDACS